MPVREDTDLLDEQHLEKWDVQTSTTKKNPLSNPFRLENLFRHQDKNFSQSLEIIHQKQIVV